MGRYYIVILNEARLERLDIARAARMVTPSGSWTDAHDQDYNDKRPYIFTLLGLRLPEINDVPLLLGFTMTYK